MVLIMRKQVEHLKTVPNKTRDEKSIAFSNMLVKNLNVTYITMALTLGHELGLF